MLHQDKSEQEIHTNYSATHDNRGDSFWCPWKVSDKWAEGLGLHGNAESSDWNLLLLPVVSDRRKLKPGSLWAPTHRKGSSSHVINCPPPWPGAHTSTSFIRGQLRGNGVTFAPTDPDCHAIEAKITPNAHITTKTKLVCYFSTKENVGVVRRSWTRILLANIGEPLDGLSHFRDWLGGPGGQTSRNKCKFRRFVLLINLPRMRKRSQMTQKRLTNSELSLDLKCACSARILHICMGKIVNAFCQWMAQDFHNSAHPIHDRKMAFSLPFIKPHFRNVQRVHFVSSLSSAHSCEFLQVETPQKAVQICSWRKRNKSFFSSKRLLWWIEHNYFVLCIFACFLFCCLFCFCRKKCWEKWLSRISSFAQSSSEHCFQFCVRVSGCTPWCKSWPKIMRGLDLAIADHLAPFQWRCAALCVLRPRAGRERARLIDVCRSELHCSAASCERESDKRSNFLRSTQERSIRKYSRQKNTRICTQKLDVDSTWKVAIFCRKWQARDFSNTFPSKFAGSNTFKWAQEVDDKGQEHYEASLYDTVSWEKYWESKWEPLLVVISSTRPPWYADIPDSKLFSCVITLLIEITCQFFRKPTLFWWSWGHTHTAPFLFIPWHLITPHEKPQWKHLSAFPLSTNNRRIWPLKTSCIFFPSHSNVKLLFLWLEFCLEWYLASASATNNNVHILSKMDRFLMVFFSFTSYVQHEYQPFVGSVSYDRPSDKLKISNNPCDRYEK